MEKREKLELLADILDVEPTEIKEEMELEVAGDWCSVAMLSFIVMMGEEFGKEISGEEVRKLVTVSDALLMME